MGYTKSGNECEFCSVKPSLGSVFGASVGVQFVVFIIFIVLYIQAGKPKKKKKKETQEGINEQQEDAPEQSLEDHIKANRSTDSAKRFVGDQLVIGRVETGAGKSGGDATKSDSQVLMDRFKVFYGWLQIFTTLTMTFDLPWPPSLASFSLSLGVINLDFGVLFSGVACEYAVPFADMFIVHMLLPATLIMLTVAARIPAYLMFKTKERRQKQKELLYKLCTTIALVMYPGLCVKIFTAFKCVSVDGLQGSMIHDHGEHSGMVMLVNYQAECGGTEHRALITAAVFFIVLWVAGIPISVLIALRAHRAALYDATHPRHKEVIHEFGTLYMAYEPEYWYWEIVVILKKMMLTYVVVVVVVVAVVVAAVAAFVSAAAALIVCILLLMFFFHLPIPIPLVPV